MGYFESYRYLKDYVDLDVDQISLYNGRLNVHNLPFESKNYNILPGEDSYSDQGKNFPKTPDYRHSISPEINELLNLADSKVNENRSFRYSVFMPAGIKKSTGVILLFHGLNEKNWIKYLPWAEALVRKTGKAVILFPLAFHMNRAPNDWSDFRMMNNMRYIREGLFPAIVGSSFANVAISTRLHILPQRFFWSGLQTFYDVIQLIHQIRQNNHPLFADHAAIDFFAYSIGSFLSEVLMMSNPDGILNNSQLFIFCGGPVFNRMSPVRKTIIDSEANIALYSFFLEHLEVYLKSDKRLAHYFSESHPEGMVFRSMVDYNKLIDFREDKINEISSRLMVQVLKNDAVVPFYEVLNTLTGLQRNIPVQIHVHDLLYPYSHENPFPLIEKHKTSVDQEFDRIFQMAADFLS